MQPRYFADVREEMAAADLTFAGNTVFAFNDIDLCVAPKLRGEFEGRSRLQREVLLDYLMSRDRRQDIYVKSSTPDPAAAAAFLDQKIFAIPVVPPSRFRQGLPNLGYEHHPFSDPIYAAIADAQCDGVCRPADLKAHAKLARHPGEAVDEAFRKLVATGHFALCRRAPEGPVEASHSVPPEISFPLAHNVALLERGARRDFDTFLISPLAGGDAVGINPIDALMLHEWAGNGYDGLIERCLEALSGRAGSIDAQGQQRPLKSISEPELYGVTQTFLGWKLGYLARLGIVEVAQ